MKKNTNIVWYIVVFCVGYLLGMLVRCKQNVKNSPEIIVKQLDFNCYDTINHIKKDSIHNLDTNDKLLWLDSVIQQRYRKL